MGNLSVHAECIKKAIELNLVPEGNDKVSDEENQLLDRFSRMKVTIASKTCSVNDLKNQCRAWPSSYRKTAFSKRKEFVLRAFSGHNQPLTIIHVVAQKISFQMNSDFFL